MQCSHAPARRYVRAQSGLGIVDLAVPDKHASYRSKYTADRLIPGAFDGETITRRRFMTGTAHTAGAIAAGAFTLPALAFSIGPIFKSTPHTWETVGKVGSFPNDNYIPVIVTHDFQNGQMHTAPPTGPGANVLPYIKAFVNVPFWQAAQALQCPIAVHPFCFGDMFNVATALRLDDDAHGDETEGLTDMPYPPDYPKMPGEPKRVQPSRDRDRPPD